MSDDCCADTVLSLVIPASRQRGSIPLVCHLRRSSLGIHPFSFLLLTFYFSLFTSSEDGFPITPVGNDCDGDGFSIQVFLCPSTKARDTCQEESH